MFSWYGSRLLHAPAYLAALTAIPVIIETTRPLRLIHLLIACTLFGALFALSYPYYRYYVDPDARCLPDHGQARSGRRILAPDKMLCGVRCILRW